jgi:hypothetical protein
MSVKIRNVQSGFVVSAEVQLMALILVLGLVAGWVKLRDQSLAELKDSMAAVDAYIEGSAPVWQTGGTRWISGGAIVEPFATGPIREQWNKAVIGDPAVLFPASAAEPLPGFPGVYRSRAGFLVYGDPPGDEGALAFPVSTPASRDGERQ